MYYLCSPFKTNSSKEQSPSSAGCSGIPAYGCHSPLPQLRTGVGVQVARGDRLQPSAECQLFLSELNPNGGTGCGGRERRAERHKAWLCDRENVAFLTVISSMLSSSLFSGRHVRLWGDLGLKAEREGKGKREAGRRGGREKNEVLRVAS